MSGSPFLYAHFGSAETLNGFFLGEESLSVKLQKSQFKKKPIQPQLELQN